MDAFIQVSVLLRRASPSLAFRSGRAWQQRNYYWPAA